MNLVIASGKGGVGKSMLTSTLATLFAKEYKIVATDCDADTPNLAIWLGGIKKWDEVLPVVTAERPEFDLAKCDGCGLCAKNCRFEAIKMKQTKPILNKFLCEGCGACEAICPQGAIKLKPIQNGEIKIKKDLAGFPLVSGQLSPGETGSGKIVDEIKAEAEKFNPAMMIIDSAPGTGCPVTAALKDANFTVLISEPTPSGFTDLKRVLEVVDHFKIPYGVVINKWDINTKLSDELKKWAGNKFLGKITYDKRIFKTISNLTPLLETDLKAKEEIKNIFEKLKAVLEMNIFES
ncbi:MAG: ATP-binding protein [Patescibacteria group bacterium]|nr:ATP-binding protein [Patescibacteria group bacterium]